MAEKPLNFDKSAGPLVSVGMPIFNCEKTLGLAIRSILHQTYRNWELLLIDDGSTDKTLPVAQSFEDPRIKVITDGVHTGIAQRLNQAVIMSKGKYFARMDGDDISYPQRFELQVKYLEDRPDVDLLGSKILVFKGNGQVLGTRNVAESHEEICRRIWRRFRLTHATWMGRVEWFRTHPYRPEATGAEDQDLLLRTYTLSRFACLPEILLGYREECLSLKKILNRRYTLSKTFFREGYLKGQYCWFLKGIVAEVVKVPLDIFAVSTGLNYRILKHRAGPVDDMSLERWRNVWVQVQTIHEPPVT